MATTKNWRQNFFFRLGELKTLVLKTHFVHEVDCFLRAGHKCSINTANLDTLLL